jgi:hypothetical protein
MNYVVHFPYLGVVIHCTTMDQVAICPMLKNSESYTVYQTNQDLPPGTEIADWAWQKGIEMGEIKLLPPAKSC